MTNGNVTGRIPEVKIHYIEQKTNINDESIEFRSYSVFFMRPDFWKVMEASEGIPPVNLRTLKLSKNFISRSIQQETQEKVMKVFNRRL